MANICEVKLQFRDSTSDEDYMMVRDKGLLDQIPLLVRSIASQNIYWETTPLYIHEPIPIPFKRAAVEFLFQHVRKYRTPHDDSTSDDYPEANQQDLDFLKQLIELASFMECTPFQKAIAFVIAQKFNKKQDVANIADFFGVPCDPNRGFFDAEDGWIPVVDEKNL